jgi:septal ring factor EnvC (AmiA/AmiB activator)
VIDSLFSGLVIDLSSNSQNRQSIADAFLTLWYLMNCKEPETFQIFVTGFLVISEQADQAKQKTELQLSSQLTEQELKISELTKTNEEHESELQRLRHSHERLIEKYDKERTVSSDNERLQQKVVKLKKECWESKPIIPDSPPKQNTEEQNSKNFEKKTEFSPRDC